MTRSEEVRQLLSLTPEEVRQKAGGRLLVVENVDQLYRHCADSIAQEIAANNELGLPTKLILPVGPVGQYPLLAERVNVDRIQLDHCWFFMMDEQCGADGFPLSPDHPLSFQYAFNEAFTRNVAESFRVPPEQVVFPNRDNLEDINKKISVLGGIDTTYGGIGIHGHIAFNEPEPNVRDSDSREVQLNDFTRTINAIRSQVGGNLENFPRRAFTLGMRQLLGAKRIRLYCRNGIDLDWANTILRLAVLGTPGDDYPVTHIRDHSDYVIVTDEDTLKQPLILL